MRLFVTLPLALLALTQAPFEPGPQVGAKIPALTALDQAGRQRDFASLDGPKGLYLVFVRSADW
jgi:hypothetical protein